MAHGEDPNRDQQESDQGDRARQTNKRGVRCRRRTKPIGKSRPNRRVRHRRSISESVLEFHPGDAFEKRTQIDRKRVHPP